MVKLSFDMIKNNKSFLSPITFPSIGYSSLSNMTHYALFLCPFVSFFRSKVYKNIFPFRFISLFTVHVVIAAFSSVFCYKSEMTRRKLPAIRDAAINWFCD